MAGGKHWHTFHVGNRDDASPVPIVGDAGIATAGVADGRMVPLVILDTRKRPALAEAIRVHQDFGVGDVVCQWGELPPVSTGRITLFLQFVRPVQQTTLIEFDIIKQGILVEYILTAHGLYIQAGQPGDRLIHNTALPKMSIEVPDTGFRPYWEKLYFKAVTTHARRNGLNRTDAKVAARHFIDEIKGFTRFRMNGGSAVDEPRMPVQGLDR